MMTSKTLSHIHDLRMCAHFHKKIMTQNKVVTGLHIVGQIYTLSDNTHNVCIGDFRGFLRALLIKYNLKELGSSYHSFGEDEGFTGVTCLIESHIAIHTWPEHNYVTLDVFLCNYSRNNEETCRRVFDEICLYFNPVSIDKQEIIR